MRLIGGTLAALSLAVVTTGCSTGGGPDITAPEPTHTAAVKHTTKPKPEPVLNVGDTVNWVPRDGSFAKVTVQQAGYVRGNWMQVRLRVKDWGAGPVNPQLLEPDLFQADDGQVYDGLAVSDVMSQCPDLQEAPVLRTVDQYTEGCVWFTVPKPGTMHFKTYTGYDSNGQATYRPVFAMKVQPRTTQRSGS